MANLRDVVGFLCANYPHKVELSKARLTKMVYLADWKSALDKKRQITSIAWKFNHFGPYVEDVTNVAMRDANFNVAHEVNMYGNRKDLISLKHNFDFEKNLSPDDIHTLKHVIDQTKRLTFDEFIQLVYSTYPVVAGARGSVLNLVYFASRRSAENI